MSWISKILLFACIVLPVLLVALYSYSQIRKSTIERLYQERSSIASLSAQVLKEKFDRLKDLGLSLSSRLLVKQYVDEGKWNLAIKSLEPALRDFPQIAHVFVADTTGTFMADVPHGPDVIIGKNFAYRDWYQGFKRTGKPYLSEVYKLFANPHIVTALAVPVKNMNEEIRGILVLQVTVDVLLGWSSEVSVGKSGFLYVIDQKGHIAANPEYSAGDSVIDYSSVPAVQKALRGEKNVEVLYNPIAGEHRLSAYEQIPGYGWAVIVQQEDTAAFGANSSLRSIQLIYLIAIASASVFAFLVTKEIDLRKKAENKFKNLLESAPDAMVIVNEAGEIELINSQAETIFGYPSKELVGERVEKLIPDRFQKNHQAHRESFFSAPLAREMGAGLELFAKKKNGMEFPVEISLSPLKVEGEALVSAAIRDITERKQTEKKIMFFAAIANCIEDVIMVTNLDFKIMSWNSAAERLLGWKESEIVGQQTAVLNPQYPTATKELALQSIQENGSWNGEIMATGKSGEPVNFMATYSSMKDEQNKTTGYLVLARDITKEKKAQEQINFLARMVESTGEAMYSVAPDFHVLSWNKGAEIIYGFNREEVIGKSVYDFIRSPMPPEQRQRIREKILASENWQDELEHFRKDGQLVHVMATTSVIKNSSGETVGYVSIARDITVRKKAEIFLQESEHKFNSLFKANPAGIIITRLSDSMIVEVNDSFCAMFGFSSEQLIGHSASEAGMEIDREKRKVVYDQLKNRGHISNVEMEITNKLGKVIYALYSSQLIFFENTQHALTVVYDVSELKKVQQQVITLNKELEAFSYSVSHDLRAPLRSIDGYANILVEDYGPMLGEEGQKIIGTITRNAGKMGQLIDDMLNLSRVTRLKISPATVNMNDIVNKILAETLINGQPVTEKVEFKIAPLLPARVDLDMIRQVWINYISNAVKYSGKREHPQVEIGSYYDKAEVIYFVKDNGTGFDNQYVNKLFGVFQRLHRANEFEGTGVGLAIVKRIVEKHGGHVRAEGQPNKGATFYFSLPIN